MSGRYAFLSAWLVLLTTSLLPVSAEPDSASGLYLANRDDNGRYFNPWRPEGGPSLLRFLRAYLGHNPYDGNGPEVPLALRDALPDDNAAATVTWIGHATVAIQDGGDLVLTDPNFNDNSSIYIRKTPPGVPLDAIPQPLFAVISHNHYDHMDKPSVLGLPAETRWLVPMGLEKWFKRQGRHNVTELDWWQSIAIGDWIATCVPAQHWSLRLGQPRNSTLWCGWLIESPSHRYYFAGDTGYFAGFDEIGRRFGKIDLALMPIGSYSPREFLAYQHLDPAEALQAFDDLDAATMLPIHWGAFDFTQEPVGEPAAELSRLLDSHPKLKDRVEILPVGGSLTLSR